MPPLTYLEAIRQALREEMERDPAVFLLGEDIGAYGGAFKATDGLQQQFGELRVLDTPSSEAGFVGAAVGAALVGMRPVVEIQFADFISLAVEPICNIAAKAHWRYGAPVPMVVRAPYGGGISGGPYHSQCVESWFTCVAGLKIVAPSTAADAKGLLKAAIRDDDPVLYLEHKFLYRRVRGEVPDDPDFTVPIGRADIKREGKDLSIITYGATVHDALEAAAELEREGVDAEVLDLRTLLPLDRQAIAATARKTSRVLVAHEAPRSYGPGAEVAALIAEEAFDRLRAPVLRVAAPDTPVPFAPALEAAYLPRAPRILEAARRLVGAV